ncbi:S1 family peptidase [Azospirillum sp. YIM DDC1]|uniref:S1 family peptidase n=1 Tax=Azospirillum aestuarii TaxID=2802052 RepID=A0ABS1I6N2_9PROT|nr:S1 family peptidase [Azospirillum aestuarii]MBK4722692.1 S1 family peptidase [Azospirillum aestuarii]
MRLTLIVSTVLGALIVVFGPAVAIEGGRPAPKGSPVANSVVAVYNAAMDTLCTGVVVTRTAVMTAAHCATADEAVTVIFQTDTKNRMEEGAAIAAHVVAAPVWHERKNTQIDRGDVALALLDRPVPPTYAPVVLLDVDAVDRARHTTLRHTARGTLAGYGNKSWSRTLGAGHLRVLSLDEPVWAWGTSEFLVETVHGSVCEGDSGGPLFLSVSSDVTGILAIVSRSLLNYGDRLCFHRVGLTAVAPFRTWIDGVLTAHRSEPALWWQGSRP